MARAIYEAPEFVAEDDELTLLACRRITFDWVLRRYLEKIPRIAYRDGVGVEGLVARPGRNGGPPIVTGVRTSDAVGSGVLEADLVVDATGRNTKLRSWLEEIGAAPLEEESQACGIFYSSRFYRLRDGIDPPPLEGPIGADLGYMKYAIFPGDSRIFSVTPRGFARRPGDASAASNRRVYPRDAGPAGDLCVGGPGGLGTDHEGLRLREPFRSQALFSCAMASPWPWEFFPSETRWSTRTPFRAGGARWVGWPPGPWPTPWPPIRPTCAPLRAISTNGFAAR